jgi:hypothetical protein
LQEILTEYYGVATTSRNLAKYERRRAKFENSSKPSIKCFRSLFLSNDLDSGGIINYLFFTASYNRQFYFKNRFEDLNWMFDALSKSNKKIFISFEGGESENYLIEYEGGRLLERGFHEALDLISEWVHKHFHSHDLLNFTSIQKVSDLEIEDILSKKIKYKTKSLISMIKQPEEITGFKDGDIEFFLTSPDNLSLNYDIDGFCGVLTQTNAKGVRPMIEVDYLNTRQRLPINKKKTIYCNNRFIGIKHLFNMLIGSLYVSRTESVNFFLTFSLVRKSMTEKEKMKIKAKVNFLMESILSGCMEEERFMAFKNGFRFEKTNQFSRFRGFIDGHNLEILLTRAKRLVKEAESFIYFEVYNTKKVYSSSKYAEVVEQVHALFDLSIIYLDIDMCTSAHIKSDMSNTLVMPMNFLDTGILNSSYTLMNCQNITNYNSSTAEYNSKRLKLFASGCSKINFYTPIITDFLENSLRKNKFPIFSALKAVSKYFEGKKSSSFEAKYKKKISLLQTSKDVIATTKNRSLHIRFEMTIKSFSLFEYPDLINKIVYNRVLGKVDTNKILESVISGIDSLTAAINQPALRVLDLARMSYNEVAFFEFCIRGGRNLHILPGACRRSLEEKRSRNQIEKIQSDYHYDFSQKESCDIIGKLFKYCKFILPVYKHKVQAILDFTISLTESPNQMFSTITNSLIEAVCKRYKRDHSEFFEETISRNVAAVGFQEIFKAFFLEPNNTYRNSMYYCFYKTMISEIGSDAAMNNMQRAFIDLGVVNFYLAKKSSISTFRKVNYDNSFSGITLESKLAFIRKSIVQLSLSNEHKLPDESRPVSLSERVLFCYAVNKIYEKSACQASLISDYRFPFYAYCEKTRLYYANKNADSRFRKEFRNPSNIDFVDILMNIIDINRFSVINIVSFLNTNGMMVKYPESVRLMDEILETAKNNEFIPKCDKFYIELCNLQKEKNFFAFEENMYNIPNSKILQCLFNYQGIDYKPEADSHFLLRQVCFKELEVIEPMIAESNHMMDDSKVEEVCLECESSHLIDDSKVEEVCLECESSDSSSVIILHCSQVDSDPALSNCFQDYDDLPVQEFDLVESISPSSYSHNDTCLERNLTESLSILKISQPLEQKRVIIQVKEENFENPKRLKSSCFDSDNENKLYPFIKVVSGNLAAFVPSLRFKLLEVIISTCKNGLTTPKAVKIELNRLGLSQITSSNYFIKETQSLLDIKLLVKSNNYRIKISSEASNLFKK